MEITPEITQLIKQLQSKYTATGQDLKSYLEGLLYADYLKYWEYIEVDTLLTLQKPRTNIPDEQIFIIYHQITELYFKLCLLELEQVQSNPAVTIDEMVMRVERVNRYFENLARSFEVMIDGMDQKQFLQYRMSLLPASGFQSAQYRKIEICATDFINLVAKDHRAQFNTNDSIEAMFEYIYWKAGATELSTGKKTLTLIQFEEKYTTELIQLAGDLKGKTLLSIYHRLDDSDGKLKKALRMLDAHVNINWPLVHFKTAVRYLERKPEDIAATGGTNWQKYLPPRFQKRIFFPELWTDEEKEEWGKSWVEVNVGGSFRTI